MGESDVYYAPLHIILVGMAVYVVVAMNFVSYLATRASFRSRWRRSIRAEESPHREAPTDEELRPPALAEFIGSFCIEPKQRAAVLGDREELFRREAKQFGLRRAKRFYWRDTLVSAWPFFREWIKRAGIVGLLWKALTK